MASIVSIPPPGSLFYPTIQKSQSWKFSQLKMAQQIKKKNTTARDITRKLKQIKKYVQVLGVKQCYVYTSTCTGCLYVYDHQQFASVFQHHLEATASMSGSDNVRETYILSKLPRPLKEMSTLTVKSAICNLVRDLNIDWNGPRPDWWPCLVPFQRTTEYKTGKLTLVAIPIHTCITTDVQRPYIYLNFLI